MESTVAHCRMSHNKALQPPTCLPPLRSGKHAAELGRYDDSAIMNCETFLMASGLRGIRVQVLFLQGNTTLTVSRNLSHLGQLLVGCPVDQIP